MNKKILKLIKEQNWTFPKDDFGLFTGKSGCSLAFYVISMKYKDKELNLIAENMLQESLEEISSNKDLSIDKGILGVALVVIFLRRKNYIEGDLDDILSDIDALLYKNLKNDDIKYGLSCTSGLISFLIYLVERLECTSNRDSLCSKINEASLRTVINKIGETAMPQFINLTKDVYTSIINEYPLLFLYLGKAIRLDVYSNTIYNITNTWIMYISSYYPYNNTNRLYLVIALSYLNRSIKNDYLCKYIQTLMFSIDMDEMYKEIDKKIMNINEGFFFMEMLLWASKKLINDDQFIKKIDSLYIKIQETCYPLYEDFLDTLPTTYNPQFINGFLGIETIKILYPFLFEWR